jgi:hypothetical protein
MDGRVRYLLQTLSDRKREISLRVAAMEMLLNVNRFHIGSQTDPSKSLPIDWLGASASQIRATAKSIFDDESEDGQLRSLSLQFMDADSPDILADINSIYRRTPSDQLQFAIEDLFLNISDASYGALNPPGGPIAGIVVVDPPQSCVKSTGDNVAFLVKYHFRADQIDKTGPPSIGVKGPGMLQIVLTDVRNGRRSTPKVTFLSGSIGSFTGQNWFELTLPIEVAAGQYYLWAEFTHGGQVVSDSRRQIIGITEASDARRVIVK